MANIRISFDASDALNGLRQYRDSVDKAIVESVRRGAEVLLQDCRAYVPMLTGRLRDSGHLEALEGYAFQLVWDAANLKNGYVYARRQYEEIFNHVDGRYAAKWVENAVKDNRRRYTDIVFRHVEFLLRRTMETYSGG